MSLPLELRKELLSLLGAVCEATGARTSSVLGRSRRQSTCDTRAAFVHLAAATTAATTAQIAEFLRRDRTSIDHLKKVAEAHIAQYPQFAVTITLLLQERQPPVHSVHPHLHQPAKPMNLRRATPNHKLNVYHIAQAAREIHAVLERFAADPLTTDLEALVLLRETGSHCMSHYGDIRNHRRIDGLEADPHNDDRGLESWLSLAEITADPPKPQRTHPPRNPRPAGATLQAI